MEPSCSQRHCLEAWRCRSGQQRLRASFVARTTPLLFPSIRERLGRVIFTPHPYIHPPLPSASSCGMSSQRANTVTFIGGQQLGRASFRLPTGAVREIPTPQRLAGPPDREVRRGLAWAAVVTAVSVCYFCYFCYFCYCCYCYCKIKIFVFVKLSLLRLKIIITVRLIFLLFFANFLLFETTVVFCLFGFYQANF